MFLIQPRPRIDRPLADRMIDAARSGRLERAVRLVTKGAPVDTRDPSGKTALHWAAWRNKRSQVRSLLDLGATVDAVDRIGQTPLVLASAGGHTDLTIDLLERGAAPDGVGPGCTPLTGAAVDARLSCCLALRVFGAKPELSPPWRLADRTVSIRRALRMSRLQAAVELGRVRVLERVIREDDDPATLKERLVQVARDARPRSEAALGTVGWVHAWLAREAMQGLAAEPEVRALERV